MATSRTRTSNRSRTNRSRAKSGGGRGKALALGGLSIGAVLAAAGAAAFALLRNRHGSDGSFGSGEHVPTDLMGDTHPGPEDRAVDAFRPDPTAPIPEGERDAFRPALAGAAAPTLVAGQAHEHERTDAAPS
ncbi:MAG: hypothetical protein J7500_16985 [Sphingomonas sp.]|uniref:hypothetical protein n=1 Tax=Sphingomonas sp. TaxID=28214 RepID=UPI001B150043|nr:hypothetical protein [Sphingomonas sp.]MBO9624405.1 hypothetical protein [Sphingomonas sp.]